MAVTQYRIPQGDSFCLVKSSLIDEAGVRATTLDAWEFALVIKRSPDDDDEAAIVTLVTADMTTTGGKLVAVVAPADLAALELGKLHYGVLKAKTPTGVIITLEEFIAWREPSALQEFPEGAPAEETVIVAEDGSQITTESGSPIATG